MIPPEVMQEIRRIQIRSRRAVNELFAGHYHSVFKGQGMEFQEVREYAVGDDVRLIDWNVTARTGAPHVKRLTEERERTVMLMVDASGSERFGSVHRFKHELAAEVCAVLAFSAILNNDRVGLMIFAGEVECFVPPGKGRQHVLRVIREVLYFKPKGHGTDIAEALHYLNRVVKRRAIVFLLSDFMAKNYETPLRIANQRHDVVAVTVTDPREEELPDVGWVAIVDPESGEEALVNTADPVVRTRYARRARELEESRKAVLRRARVDVVPIRTGQPYAQDLYRFFRRREKRQRI